MSIDIRRWSILGLGVCAALLLLAQAPKAGVGNPSLGYGAPAGTIFTRTGSVTVANTADETLLTTVGVGSTTIAGGILYPGRMLRLEQRGVFSALNSSSLRYRIKINGADVLDTGAETLPGAPFNANFLMQTDVVCHVSGKNGTIVIGGGLIYETTQGSATLGCNWAPLNTVSIDTTVPLTFSSSVQWGAASPSNTISVVMGDIRIFN